MSATGSTTSAGGSVSHRERVALCDLFEQVGPLAPTLCEGWTTSDLAAHLFVREARTYVAAGIAVPAFASLTQRAMDRAKSSIGYEGLVSRIRSGPPLLWRLVDSRVNTAEFFVHHEDVRRAGGEASPREDAELDAALWGLLRQVARMSTRRLSGAGLALVAPGFGTVTAKSGSPVVTMTGGPQELLLYLFGRKAVAAVSFDGPDEAVAAVEAASFGL